MQNYEPTGERLVTPDQADKWKKDTVRNSRRASAVTKKRKTAVAVAATDNGVSALAAELQLEDNSAVHPTTPALMNISTVTDSTSQPVSKRQHSINKSPSIITPAVIVQTGPPQTKCQGCVHGDLLEMNVMEPAHIKHYLKVGEYLELATCKGDCNDTIKNIHLASPKANIYYCDESNKGFYAPDDDPIKQGMECGLILCYPCHAVREETYALENKKEGVGSRRSRRRG